ncbi:putative GC-rich sequence DNA-binding factor [Lupinus albus]|uniref:Putative GC-rich sequence DNA-binding factor n=1 Tax=Lupinus albus TaxID=3870 RepID=A0A6A4QPP0_LUPAL|nr:putative GC-rich sequence DNA-binding factor [Lupinus albus]
MSTAKSRNFRRRGGNTDSNDTDTNDITSTTLPSKPPSFSTSKPKKPQAPKLLSFADETESPPLRTSSSSKPHHHRSSSATSSKPSSSHKITTHRDRISHSSSPSVPSNVQPQAGFYTKEALLELQKNTRTLVTSSNTSRHSSDSKPNSEPVLVLKGLVKPSPSEPEARDSDSEEAEAKLGFSNGKGLSGDSGSFYPDEETIKAIRAKRERLRQARPGVFEDVDERRFKGNVARDDDRDDDDGGFNDEDEEEKLWEEEQFRKGLGKRMDEGSAARADVVPVMQSAQQHSFVVPTAYSAVPGASVSLGIGGVMGAAPQSSFDVMHMSQQAEVAKKAMKQNFSRLKESHGRTTQLLNETDQNLSASLLNITDLESSLVLADEKYKFMQKLQNYVTNICDFLQHKASYIEELEEQMKKLHEDHASAISGRRETNNDDEMMEVDAAVKAATSVFSRKGNNNLEAAKSAAQDAFTAVRKQRDLPVKLDEFGRDLNLEERMKMKVRAKSRQRKRSKTFDYSKLASVELGDHKIEGESSTDESDSESQAYQSQHDLLLQAADEIFSDACEEYGQLSLVKRRFEEWKREYFTSYNDAYISLSLPLIFSPYVRLELLRWDPLHKGLDFQEMKWYKLLFTYGLPEDGKDFVNDDGDVDLVPNLVEKVALPVLHYEISHCWDMLSQQETVNAINATTLIVQHLSHESEALADLLVSIRTRLADAVAKLTVPTWSPPILAAVPDAARVAAYRFGVSVRLLRNICLWKDIFAMPVLEKLALDELLCGKVLPHIRSISENVHDAITRTERIIASLSGVWAGPNVTGERSQKLQPLVTYVLSLGRILERRNVPESDTNNLARRLKKMLVDLNEYDHAKNMTRTFRLKEAL